ncbi:unnamed protein product [Callosobruchus maculatus]|uniref:PH domain-containing protein n=2 Tax=Callosobruchus maculatus TaxID=64391 RepID=A0A653CCQ3_CALMS|nr:unnamed protein product [Callosobruchus maculatus]
MIQRNSSFTTWTRTRVCVRWLETSAKRVDCLYREALETDINLNDNNLFNREDFELSADDVKRLTILMDFGEADRCLYAAHSTESILPISPTERVSIASIVSGKSFSSSYRSSGRSNMDQEFQCGTISYLTLEALRHYQKNFSKTFHQSQVEEKVYEPGIFVTSERIMKMVAKLLHIGVDSPDPKSTMYQPIVFNCSSKAPFLLELFSRSMWLLSRTRREMKVSTITDYPKVMQVLEKQLQMVLSRRPKDFERLTAYMTEITFEEVLAKWQEEKDQEFVDLQNNNASIIELKESLSKENEQYVIHQRINVLKVGQVFPKVTEKKTGKYIFVQLSRNEKELFIFDIKNSKYTEQMSLQDKISIGDITHIATGLNCKHVRLCKSPYLAFSLIINSEKYVNFIADDEKMACYWTDAFHILTNTPRRSTYYQEELDTIVEMDVRLKLLELQNVVIPKVPPPVPPPPIEKPSVTPRTKILSNNRY